MYEIEKSCKSNGHVPFNRDMSHSAYNTHAHMRTHTQKHT